MRKKALLPKQFSLSRYLIRVSKIPLRKQRYFLLKTLSEYDDDTNEELKDLVIIDEDELELEQ